MARTTTLPPSVPALHTLAEHVLSAGLHAATGRIGLRAATGGFGTPPEDATALGGTWSVDGLDLVIEATDGERRTTPVTTVRAAGEFFGVTPGMPPAVYAPTTPLEPDRPLELHAGEVATAAAWLALGTDALAAFGAEHPDDGPTAAQLWPEHFDLGSTLGEINFGISPGDESIPEPYAYVGPPTTLSGMFWNQPFGAARTASEVPTVDDVVTFFEHGRSLVLAR